MSYIMDNEIINLYKYSITYKCGEVDEYTVILVSDNMKDLVDLIADREMVDPMDEAKKWFEIGKFLRATREDINWYRLFDIDEQDLAVKFGYDVKEQYWTCQFKNDVPKSVNDPGEIMGKFGEKIDKLHLVDEWSRFASGGVLGDALYGSKYVQDTIRKMRDDKTMHDAEEFDAGLGAIEEIVKAERLV